MSLVVLPKNRFDKMSSKDQFKIKKTGNSYILYDASIIAEPTLQLFDADYHTNSGAQQNNSALADEPTTGAGIGRAKVTYYQHEDIPLVLKHYYRGGAVASFIKDRYLGFNIENTRAFKEWRLLKKMRSFELPVPEAVAAHVEKGLLFYRADLLTREIENCITLADFLLHQGLDTGQWKKIGKCIKHFHLLDIYHADLNARNILLTDADDIYLIDFDNSYIRIGQDSWKMANLSRLKRSLLKFKNNTDGFNFDEDDWSAFLGGYVKR